MSDKPMGWPRAMTEIVGTLALLAFVGALFWQCDRNRTREHAEKMLTPCAEVAR